MAPGKPENPGVPESPGSPTVPLQPSWPGFPLDPGCPGWPCWRKKKNMFIYPSVSSFPFPVVTQYLDVLTLSSRLGSMGNYDFQRQKQTVPFFNIAAAWTRCPRQHEKMSSEGPFRKGRKAMFNAGSVKQRTKPDEAAVQGVTKNWDC